MKITKKRLKQIIKEEADAMREARDVGGEDSPTMGDIKFSGKYDQAFDDESGDIPMSKLAQGTEDIELELEQLLASGKVSQYEYDIAMNVVSLIKKQQGTLKEEEDLEQVVKEEIVKIFDEGFGERFKQHLQGIGKKSKRGQSKKTAVDMAALQAIRQMKSRGAEEPESVSADKDYAERFSSAKKRKLEEDELEEGNCPDGYFWKSAGGSGGDCVKDPDYKPEKGDSAYARGNTVSPPPGSYKYKYEE